jgi:hypothetical protein
MFESEERPGRENRTPLGRRVSKRYEMMADVFDGPAEFVDLEVLEDDVY